MLSLRYEERNSGDAMDAVAGTVKAKGGPPYQRKSELTVQEGEMIVLFLEK